MLTWYFPFVSVSDGNYRYISTFYTSRVTLILWHYYCLRCISRTGHGLQQSVSTDPCPLQPFCLAPCITQVCRDDPSPGQLGSIPSSFSLSCSPDAYFLDACCLPSHHVLTIVVDVAYLVCEVTALIRVYNSSFDMMVDQKIQKMRRR